MALQTYYEDGMTYYGNSMDLVNWVNLVNGVNLVNLNRIGGVEWQ